MAQPPAGGWLVGVMLQEPGEPAPVRHHFAVGHPDQGKAEWGAVDRALTLGAVATSPIRGLEPVAALRHLSVTRMSALGLKAGEVRTLGPHPSRRWFT